MLEINFNGPSKTFDETITHIVPHGSCYTYIIPTADVWYLSSF